MCAGISSDEGDEGRTLPEQISKAYSDANNADAKAKQAQMKINHLEKSLKVSHVCFLLLDGRISAPSVVSCSILRDIYLVC